MSESRAAALVTAGAKRIGRVLSLRLAQMGYDIALHYNSSKNDAEQTATEIRALGKECVLLNADLRKHDELAKLMQQAFESFPKLNVLVNNASIWTPKSLIDSSYEDFRENFQVHVEAPYFLIRDFARKVSDGCVINILDSNVTKATTAHFPYLLSKKTLYELTLLAATELAPKIRVNAIAPGAVLVPEDERKEKYSAKFGDNPLNRPGSPEEVADTLEFLVKSKHITGECIFLSAGKHLI